MDIRELGILIISVNSVLFVQMFFYFSVTSNPCSIFDSSCSACISGGPDCVWCSDEVIYLLHKFIVGHR